MPPMITTPRDFYRQVSLIRVATWLIWIATISTTHFDRYLALPVEARVQRGLGALLLNTELLGSLTTSQAGLAALKWTTLAGCAALIVWPRRMRLATPFILVGIVILDSISKEYNGYANHAQLVPLIAAGLFTLATPLPFASLRELWSPSGERDQSSYKQMFALTGLMLVVPYTYIGLNRIMSGGFIMFAGEGLLDSIRLNSLRDSNFGFRWFVQAVDVGWIATVLKVGFVITTLAEVLSGVVFVSERACKAWVILMTGFHLMTLLSMNILFWENMVLMYAIFGFVFRTGVPTEVQDGDCPVVGTIEAA